MSLTVSPLADDSTNVAGTNNGSTSSGGSGSGSGGSNNTENAGFRMGANTAAVLAPIALAAFML